MINGLILLNIVFLMMIILQYNAKNKRNKQLAYIQQKLHHILTKQTDEKLLLFTDDLRLIQLIEEINHLLELRKQTMTEFHKKEINIKKMLSNISHDLKTPLTVILGYVETIQLDDHINPQEKKRLLNKVHHKALEVSNMIYTFFDLARLESGDAHFNLDAINLNEICTNNILEFYDILTNKDFEVKLDIPDQIIHVMGNAEVFNRILNNLISNAIQHGGSGKFIGLTLKQKDTFAYVAISDKGKGINKLDQHKIFDRMFTLNEAQNKSYKSSGLGLAITKKLIMKMGGSIQVESKPHEITTFTFKLKTIT